MANLEQSRSWILDAWSVNLSFLLRVTSILQKLRTELKNLQHNSQIIASSKGTIFAKNANFLQKNADISKIKGVLVLKTIFSETTCVCTSGFWHNSNEF